MNLDIYIYGWVISDGNYDHFIEGETRQFALEFWAPAHLTKSTSFTRNIQPSAAYTYDVVAEVVFASADICVVDFGLLAYSESLSELEAGRQVGDLVEGNITVDVDPFFYFERLSKIAAVPPLIYAWQIDWIEQETTPYVVSEGCGSEVYVRDETRRIYERVGTTSTNVGGSPDISPAHVLHCTKLSGSPARALRAMRQRGSGW
jgi:hypothetical protein